jgi:hypothetical protein
VDLQQLGRVRLGRQPEVAHDRGRRPRHLARRISAQWLHRPASVHHHRPGRRLASRRRARRPDPDPDGEDGLDQPGLVDVLGATTKVYINDTASAFGATQRVGVVVSGEVTIELPTERRWTLDSSTAPRRVGLFGPRQVSARLVVEFDQLTDWTAFAAATAQRVRIESVGPTLGGSAYKATLDLPGVWEAFVLGEDNGVITTELTLAGQYDTTPAADIAAVVVNDRAALP